MFVGMNRELFCEMVQHLVILPLILSNIRHFFVSVRSHSNMEIYTRQIFAVKFPTQGIFPLK